MRPERELQRKWDELMLLCRREKEYRTANTHAKLVALLGNDIAELAAALGFSPRQIASREFRAEREGGRIVRLITE